MTIEGKPTSTPSTVRVEAVSGSQKSKLEIVREQILGNRKVYYAGEVIRLYGATGLYKIVAVIVAPVKPILDTEKLNVFMDGLIKGVEPSDRDAAYKQSKGGMHLGTLFFDEPIGKKTTKPRTNIDMPENEALKNADNTNGESHDAKKEEFRRTWLRVYPDSSIAKAVFDYEQGLVYGTVEQDATYEYLRHRIDREQMNKLKLNQWVKPLVRLVRILKGK